MCRGSRVRRTELPSSGSRPEGRRHRTTVRGAALLVRAALVVGLALVAAPSAAQELPGATSAGRTRSPLLDVSLDSLREEVRRAESRADEARSRWRAARLDSIRARADTFRVGPLRVVARPEHARWGAELFGEVWEAGFRRAVGDSVRPFGEATVGFEVGGGLPGGRRLHLEHGDVVRVGAMSRWLGAPERVVAGKVGEALAGGLPTAWEIALGHHDLQVGMTDPGLVYRRVVTAPSISARRCLAGEGRECWVALDLLPTEEPALRWYTPRERRVAVRREGRRGPRWIGDYEACVHGGSDEACLRYLRGGTPAPLDWMAVRSLASFALEVGGEGSYERLLAGGRRDRQGLRTALAAAADMDPDRLAAAWADELRASRPDRSEEARKARWATLLWTIVFAGLAMRSTRWRSD